jgi:hypothetical protein
VGAFGFGFWIFGFGVRVGLAQKFKLTVMKEVLEQLCVFGFLG